MQTILFYVSIVGGIAAILNIAILLWKRFAKNIKAVETPVHILVAFYLVILALATYYVFYQ